MISIVICTYNRAHLLAGALQSVCEQPLDSSEYELIVVDNNSTDNTRAVTESFAQRYPNLRYCFEPQQGLSHARNRGFWCAQGEYVGYLDDDAKASAAWLAVAQEIITRLAPGVFGGPYYAFYNSPQPRWWKDSYRSREHAEKARPLTGYYEDLSGNNIFFRRTLLEKMGGFDPQFGMSGDKIATCEETEFLLRIRETMPNELIYYDPRLTITHLVHAKKMTFKWLIRHRFADGRSHGRMYHASKPLSKRKLLRQSTRLLLSLVKHLVRSVWGREQTQYPYVQNYWFEQALPRVEKLGSLYEQWQMVFERKK